ncbi:MAG: hypothetical protein DWQ37_09985 [Planctomycetota bacterium]|nr:MAG: hypothetical protein DWQ37_09985 [Planctomycetota bacterium]
MTLKAQLEQTLAGMAPFSTGEQSVSLSDGDLHLTCQLVALESLGCAFSRLALSSDRLAGLDTDGLKRVAEDLSAKLTYLLEPISPIETDAEGCVVQMRSNPPHKDADRTSYYELLVARTGELSLTRYTRAAGQPRESVPAHVTREVLCRLAGDLAEAAA